MLYFNPTVFGQKALRFLASMDQDNKPDAITFVEVHLRGAELNAMRRRVENLGWRMMATQAITRDALLTAACESAGQMGQDADADEQVNSDSALAKFHTCGGEAILVQPGT